MHLSGVQTRIVAIVICLITAGCETITGEMWADANQVALPYKSLRQTSSDANPPSNSLIFEYNSSDRTKRLSVPLDADGWPLPPFDCGHVLVNRESWASIGITERQRLQIFETAGVPRVYWDMNARSGSPPDSPTVSDPMVSVIVVGYEWTKGEQAGEAPFDDLRFGGREHRDLRLAVIPSDLPVDWKDRSARRTRASVLTPFTVMGDALEFTAVVPVFIILSPIVVPMILTLNHPPIPEAARLRVGGHAAPIEPEIVSLHNVNYVRAAIRPPETP